jgi:hypothetical protein
MLRSRQTRREESLETRLPDPVIGRVDRDDPEHEALLADAVGLALLVVLQTLSPAERLAFVLHDMFAVPCHEIAPMADRSRRRPASSSAAREGEFERLVALLDPDVVLRVDFGPDAAIPFRVLQVAEEVAAQASMYGRSAGATHLVLVNGAVGEVRFPASACSLSWPRPSPAGGSSRWTSSPTRSARRV